MPKNPQGPICKNCGVRMYFSFSKPIKTDIFIDKEIWYKCNCGATSRVLQEHKEIEFKLPSSTIKMLGNT